MFKITKFIVATAFAALIAGCAQGIEFLGPSNDAADGNEGILGFNELCLDTFNKSLFCTSSHILRSGSTSFAGVGFVWVAPSIVGLTFDSATSKVVELDITGKRSIPTLQGMSCNGWANSGTVHGGLAMNENGSFQVAQCNSTFRAACCKVKERFR